MRTILSVCLLYTISTVATAQNNLFIQPIATTVQLPTFGVSFDADGVLQTKTFTDPTGQLIAERLAAVRAALPGNLARPADLRKVSVVRLERALAKRMRAGDGPSDVMSHLAGLTRITAIFCYPDRGDVVLAGPAEPWIEDLSGQAVGIHSGRPTLRLEDLAVALRAYKPDSQHEAFVGCTISPRQENLAELRRFQQQIPRTVPDNRRQQVAKWVTDGVRDSLGMADVRVFGIPARTHFARVMIEADYRMKRMAVGIEPPPIRMTTFASALSTAQNGALQRWWFTPAYDGVRATPDRLAMEMKGQGVQLNTENKDIGIDGAIIQAGKPTRASKAYATSFTQQYDAIAKVSRVYAQLRQLTDLLIVAAYLREFDWYGQTGWRAEVLLDENAFGVASLNTPATAPVVVNTFWKGRRMFSPAGGGVSIVAENALKQMSDYAPLGDQRDAITLPDDENSWWWD